MTIQTELQKIRERADEATPGPWGTYGGANQDVRTEIGKTEFRYMEISNRKDAKFIAHARMDIPRLLACVERLVEGLTAECFCMVGEYPYCRCCQIKAEASAILTGESEKGDRG